MKIVFLVSLILLPTYANATPIRPRLVACIRSLRDLVNDNTKKPNQYLDALPGSPDQKRDLARGNLRAWDYYFENLSVGGNSFEIAGQLAEIFERLPQKRQQEILRHFPDFRLRAKVQHLASGDEHKLAGDLLLDYFYKAAMRGDLLFLDAYKKSGSAKEAYGLFYSFNQRIFGKDFSYEHVIKVLKLIQQDLRQTKEDWPSINATLPYRESFYLGKTQYSSHPNFSPLIVSGDLINAREFNSVANIETGHQLLSVEQHKRLEKAVKDYLDRNLVSGSSSNGYHVVINNRLIGWSYFTRVSPIAFEVSLDAIKILISTPDKPRADGGLDAGHIDVFDFE